MTLCMNIYLYSTEPKNLTHIEHDNFVEYLKDT